MRILLVREVFLRSRCSLIVILGASILERVPVAANAYLIAPSFVHSIQHPRKFSTISRRVEIQRKEMLDESESGERVIDHSDETCERRNEEWKFHPVVR